jgi:CRP-like cAMP-binding protein
MAKVMLPDDKLLKHSFYKAGNTVFNQGDKGKDIYILKTGAVTVKVDGQIMGLINTPGTIIGEMAYFLGNQRTATVEAIEDAEFSVITGDYLQETLMKNPEIAIDLLKILSERLANTTKFATRLERDIVNYRNELRKGQGLKEDKKPTVLEELLSQGFITKEQMQECDKEIEKIKAKGAPISLPKILIENGFLTAEEFIRFLEMKQVK